MNIRYSLLFLLVLFTSGSIAFAQTSINGKVIDSKTNAPLKGATVRIDGTTIGSLTNKDGSFSLKIGKGGDYKLSINFVGYKKTIHICKSKRQ